MKFEIERIGKKGIKLKKEFVTSENKFKKKPVA